MEENGDKVTCLQFTHANLSAIIEDEKVIIRQNFLQGLTLHLPRPWITTNAYAIGRIARHDFPRFWPDLVTQLLTAVRHAVELEQGGQDQWLTENALIGLSSVVKELSSVKLGMAVSAFHQVVPPLERKLILGYARDFQVPRWRI